MWRTVIRDNGFSVTLNCGHTSRLIGRKRRDLQIWCDACSKINRKMDEHVHQGREISEEDIRKWKQIQPKD